MCKEVSYLKKLEHVSLRFNFIFFIGEDGYGCLWQDCLFVTTSLSEVVRHIHFHSFHTHLKSMGAEIVRKTSIHPCKLVIKINLLSHTLKNDYLLSYRFSLHFMEVTFLSFLCFWVQK